MVWHDENTVLLGELRYAHRFGESCGPRGIELKILDGPALDEIANGETMDLALAVRQGDTRCAGKLHVVVRLQVPMQRLFEPRDVVRLDPVRKAYAVIQTIGRVHVEHQENVAPDRFAHRSHTLY